MKTYKRPPRHVGSYRNPTLQTKVSFFPCDVNLRRADPKAYKKAVPIGNGCQDTFRPITINLFHILYSDISTPANPTLARPANAANTYVRDIWDRAAFKKSPHASEKDSTPLFHFILPISRTWIETTASPAWRQDRRWRSPIPSDLRAHSFV